MLPAETDPRPTSPAVGRLDRQFDGFFRRLETVAVAWLTPGPVSGCWRPWVVFIAVTAVIVFAVLVMGPYPVTIYPDDTMYMLVQGDYLQRGMRPYVDYYSMHGPLPFVFSALGLWVAGVSLEAVIVAQVIGAVFFGVLVFLATRNRLHNTLAVLTAVCAELLLVSCSPIGEKSWREFSCAMWYNSVGYVLYAIVFVHLLAPSRGAGRAWRVVESAIVAFALAAAFCTKATFCAPMVLLFIFGDLIVPRQPSDRLYALGSLAGAAGLAVAFMAALGGSIEGYLTFLDGMTFRVHPLLLSLRFLHYTRTIGVFVLAVVIIFWLASRAGVTRQTRREFILIGPMLASLMLSASTASQDQEVLPLLGVLPVALATTVGIAAQRRGVQLQSSLLVCAMGLMALLLLHEPKNSVLSWAFSHMNVPTLSGDVDTGNAVPAVLTPAADPQFFRWMPEKWSEHQQAALRLLNDYSNDTSEPLFVATDTSAIPMLTGRVYAKGQVAWWPLVFAKDPRDVPLTREDLLEDAKWILRDGGSDLVWTYLEHHRGEYLEESFELVGEAPGWRLYGRRDRTPLAPSVPANGPPD